MVDNDEFDDDMVSQFSTQTPEYSQSQVGIEMARIEARERAKRETELGSLNQR